MESTELVRTYLDRRGAIAILASCDPKGVPDCCLLIAPELTSDGRIAGGEEDGVGGRTFRNLRQNARGTILILDPVMDPRSRDGVRIEVEFLGAEADGEGLKHLTEWLGTFAPGRKIARRLIFKILEVNSYRPPDASPIFGDMHVE